MNSIFYPSSEQQEEGRKQKVNVYRKGQRMATKDIS